MAKKKFSKATKGIFNRFFGFENGIDITNEVAVLHRRNVVIKNIIFISNIFFSVLLAIFAAFSDAAANWIFALIFFPFTFFLNSVINHLIKIDRHDKSRQQIAMYVMAIYLFVSVVLVYARFYHEPYFETTTYVLIYYAVVVISLYQSKPLMLWSIGGMIAAITIIHSVTFGLSDLAEGKSFIEFIQTFGKSEPFYDLLLRTLIFVIFSVVVYAIVSMGHYMQEERKNELIKRREIQEDFTNIVSDLFKVVLSAKSPFIDRQHINLVHKMSMHLANVYGATAIELEEIDEYAKIHLKIDEIAMLIDPEEAKEINYNELKDKTELGTLIAKRIQLAQKVDDIARTHIEEAVNREFIVEMNQIQQEITSQIILLADLYITMRGQQSYKRPFTNSLVIKLFKEDFSRYFEPHLLARFVLYQQEFEKIYNDA